MENKKPNQNNKGNNHITPAEEEAEIKRLEELAENSDFQQQSADGDKYH